MAAIFWVLALAALLLAGLCWLDIGEKRHRTVTGFIARSAVSSLFLLYALIAVIVAVEGVK